MFPYGQLKEVLKKADVKLLTDESSAFEQAGIMPLMVKGRNDNLKLTHIEDLLVAEYILKKNKNK